MRKSGRVNALPPFATGNDSGQQVELRALTAAVDALNGDEPAESASVYLWTQTSLNSWVTHKVYRTNFSLTAVFRRCNAAHVTMRDSSGTE